jgi:hypothetical protein
LIQTPSSPPTSLVSPPKTSSLLPFYKQQRDRKRRGVPVHSPAALLVPPLFSVCLYSFAPARPSPPRHLSLPLVIF